MLKPRKYSFRVYDDSIIEVLETLKPSQRSDYIRNALLFYILHGEKIEQMLEEMRDVPQKLDNILEKIERLPGKGVAADKNSAEEKSDERELRKKLRESLDNFIEF